jgi:myo-inositol-1(or 4)-monophosphatase
MRIKTMTERLKIITSLARQAGKLALDMRAKATASLKEDGTFVTDADLAVQAFLFKEIARQFPDYGILGEENGCEQCAVEPGRSIFVIDPIDGTDVYRCGLAYFAVSIGLYEDGRFTLGVIYSPVLDEMFSVDTGLPPTKNGRPLSICSDCEISAHSFLAAPSRFHRRFTTDFPGKIRSLGSTAYHLALVASGQSVGAVPYAFIWDIAAGVALVEAAGGKVARIGGEPFDYRDYMNPKRLPRDLLAAPANLFDSLSAMFHVKP